MLLLLFVAGAPQAQAAEVTDLPPFLRGDATVGYRAHLESFTLHEDGAAVGAAREESHVLGVELAVGFTPWSAFTVEIPASLQQRVVYTDARAMIFDPINEEGSLAQGPAIADGVPAREGSGLEGIWLNLEGAPFSERRGHRTSWLLGVAYRTPDKSSFWDYDGEGYGAGPGASAWRLRTAFSTTKGNVQPYLDATYLFQSDLRVALVDTDGQIAATRSDVRPSNEVDVLTGIEAVTARGAEDRSYFAIDLHGGFGYRSWAELPSGLYLPTVLPDTEAQSTTASEHAVFTGGLGVHWKVFPYMKLNLGMDVDWYTPHRLESAYPVLTGFDSIGVRAGASLQVLLHELNVQAEPFSGG